MGIFICKNYGQKQKTCIRMMKINIFFSIPATKFFIVSNVHPIDRCQIYRGGCAMAMAMYGYGYGC